MFCSPILRRRFQFKTNDRTKNNLSIAALTVLGGFSGMGIIWIVICILIPLLKIPENKFLPLNLSVVHCRLDCQRRRQLLFLSISFQGKGSDEVCSGTNAEKICGLWWLEQPVKLVDFCWNTDAIDHCFGAGA